MNNVVKVKPIIHTQKTTRSLGICSSFIKEIILNATGQKKNADDTFFYLKYEWDFLIGKKKSELKSTTALAGWLG